MTIINRYSIAIRSLLVSKSPQINRLLLLLKKTNNNNLLMISINTHSKAPIYSSSKTTTLFKSTKTTFTFINVRINKNTLSNKVFNCLIYIKLTSKYTKKNYPSYPHHYLLSTSDYQSTLKTYSKNPHPWTSENPPFIQQIEKPSAAGILNTWTIAKVSSLSNKISSFHKLLLNPKIMPNFQHYSTYLKLYYLIFYGWINPTFKTKKRSWISLMSSIKEISHNMKTISFIYV